MCDTSIDCQSNGQSPATDGQKRRVMKTGGEKKSTSVVGVGVVVVLDRPGLRWLRAVAVLPESVCVCVISQPANENI